MLSTRQNNDILCWCCCGCPRDSTVVRIAGKGNCVMHHLKLYSNLFYQPIPHVPIRKRELHKLFPSVLYLQQPELESKPKQPQPSSSTISSGGGRSSSLAQRRAQFHASRQHSEAAERRPPLVRAMSAPIRPIDTDSKFLQSKKKSRKKKILR